MKQTSEAGVAVDATEKTAPDAAPQRLRHAARAARDLRGFWRRALAILVPLPMLALAIEIAVVPYQVGGDLAQAMAGAAADPHAAQAALWLSMIFALTVAPATMAVAWTSRRRAPWLTLTGGVALLVAFGLGLPNTDLAVVTAARRGLDPALLTALNDAVAAHPTVDTATVLFLIGQGVGFVLLGIALWRARVLPAWLAMVLAASGPAHLLLPGGNIGAAASWAMTAIGYAGAAVALWRTRDADFDLPPIGQEPAEATGEHAINRGRDARTVWRWLLAIAAVPVPIFVAVFRYLLPYSDANAPREIFAKLVAASTYQSAVILIGSAVMVCGFAGALAVAWLTRRRTPVPTTIAMLLAVPGYIALFASGIYGDVLAYVTGVHPGLDYETAFQLGYGMESSAQSSALGTIFVVGHLFGTTALGVALWRARIAPTWLAVGLTVSQPIHLASVLTGIRLIDLVGWGLTAVGFMWAAWRLAKLPNDDFDLPPAAPNASR
jgi:hypothetical protein